MAELLPPVIMHLDMDAFFVNVELLTHPELAGQKIIVARETGRSVVVSASYEARAFGVRSAMPLARARQLCPDAVVVEPGTRYRDYSRKVMGILHELTDRVEQASIDEAYVDLTPTLKRLGDPVATAQRLRQRISANLGLPCSVGISSTKYVAKMASSASKPNGLWVIPPHRVEEFLNPLPVAQLWGVGPKTAGALERLGIHTVAQLREYSADYLMGRLGKAAGAHLYQVARGVDPRPVVTNRIEKSIGAEHTFDRDSTRAEEIGRQVYRLALTVGRRLRKTGKQAAALSLKIRFDTFETISRSCQLAVPTDSGRDIHRAVMGRLRELEIVTGGAAPRPLRLIGVRAEKLENRSRGVQQALLGEGLEPVETDFHGSWHRAETVMDLIQQKYGAHGLIPANFLAPDPSAPDARRLVVGKKNSSRWGRAGEQ